MRPSTDPPRAMREQSGPGVLPLKYVCAKLARLFYARIPAYVCNVFLNQSKEMEIRCNRYSGCGYGDNGHNIPISPLLPAAQPGDQLSTAPQSGGGYVIAPCAYPRTDVHLPTDHPRSRGSFPQHCPHAFPQSTSLIHRISLVIHNCTPAVPSRHELCQRGTTAGPHKTHFSKEKNGNTR